MSRGDLKTCEKYLRGEELLRGQGRFSDAVRLLQGGLKKYPDAAEFHFRLGWLLDQNGERVLAKKSFKRFLELEPGHARRFLAWSAIEEYGKAVEEAERVSNRWDVKYCDRFFHPWADDWFPPRPESYYAERLKRLDRRIAEARVPPTFAFFRGLLLSHLGRERECLAELDSLAKLPGKSHGWMRYAAGVSRLSLGWFASAGEDFRAVVEFRPNMWLAHCHWAEALLCLGDTSAAFARFDECESRLSPESRPEDIWAWRGEALLWIGLYKEALDVLDRALAKGSWFALGWRGAALMLLGRYEEALKDLDRAAAVGNRDAEITLWRGELLRRMGRHEEALKDLERSLETGGGTWAYVNRALVYSALGRSGEMWKDFEKVPIEPLGFVDEEIGRRGIRNLDERRVVVLLEMALKSARGVRRPEAYAAAVWMCAARDERRTKRDRHDGGKKETSKT